MHAVTRQRLTLPLLFLGAAAVLALSPALLLFERLLGGGPGTPLAERLLARALTRRGGKKRPENKSG